jgi:hypothetical protein
MSAVVAIGTTLAFHGSAVAAPVMPEPPDTTPPEISSGGDRARHVCRVIRPAACTREYRPLALSRDDRVAVRVPVSAVYVGLSVPNGDSSECVARGEGLWGCAMPAASREDRQLNVDVGYPVVDVRWTFDALVLPRSQRATDRSEKVRFRLAGRHLRVELRPGSDAGEDLWGKRVRAACVSRRWLTATPHLPVARKYVVARRFTWPRGATTHTLFFDRWLRRNALSCVIEPARDTSDIAGAFFLPLLR